MEFIMDPNYRKVRAEKGLTLENAASQIGRTKQWLSEIERGNIKLSYAESVVLAAVYGGTPDIFLPGEYDDTGQDSQQNTA
jgi:transcriptional regulator with XRE-family HTH domain